LRVAKILLICAFIFIGAAINVTATNTGHVTKDILVIHSYHQGFEWTDRVAEGIDSVLSKDKGHTIHIEYLDSKRTNYNDLKDTLHTIIAKKHSNVNFDIIIVSDNNALNFALEHRRLGHVRADMPIIFCGINASLGDINYFKEQKNITGVYEHFDLEKTIEIIKSLQPNITDVGIVADSRLQDLSIIERMKSVSGLNIIWIYDWNILTISQWLRDLPENSALIKYLFKVSNDGRKLTIDEAVNLVDSVRPDLSMYTVCDFEVGGGEKIIGGFVINGFEQGKLAAEMSERLMHGEDFEDIPSVYKSPNTPMFDYVALKKHDIDLSALPSSSVVLNIPLSFYDKYKSYFWPSVILLIIQSIIIVAFIVQRIARLKSEKLQKFTKFAIDNVKDAAFWIDSSGRFVYVNQRSCSQLGYTSKELLKKNMWDIHFNDFGKKDWEQNFSQMRTKGWEVLEHTHKSKEGKKIPVEVSSTYVKFDNEEYIIAFARDITNRIEQNKALESSERRYKTIYESTAVGMFQMDANTGKMITVNPAHAYILGYDSIEEVVENFDGWKTYTDINQIESGMAYLKETGKIDNIPIMGTKKDKTLVDLEVSATYNDDTKIIDGVILDVTDRKLAEIGLVESEKKYRALVETSPYGIEELDVRGKILYVNSAFLKMMRMTEDEVLGHYIWEFSSDPEKDNLKELFRNLPEEQPEPSTYEGKNITKGGRSFNVQVDWDYKRNRQNDVVGFVGIVSNISNLVRYRERQELSSKVLDILNSEFEAELTIKRILTLIKRFTKLDAVAIRLQEDDDYPYYITEGFEEDFVQKETTICSKDKVGDVIRHPDGTACLDCMCGMIICGNTDDNLPYFTTGGSFWTNNTDELLADGETPSGVKLKTRNRCNAEGYRSVALIPLVSPEGHNIGLLQLNDRRKDMFTLDMIEFFEGLGASIGIALGRKQAQDLIRDSEERYRSLFETVPIGIIFWSEHTHILEWNSHSEKIFGWSKEEAVGRNIFDFLIPKHERDRLQDVVGDLLDAKMPNYVINDNITKSGDVITCEWHNTVLYDEKGDVKGVISLGQDITERVKLEKDRETSSQIFNTVPSGVFIYECSDTDMILVDGNPAAESITRVTLSECKGKRFDELWPEGGKLKANLYNSCVLKDGGYENDAYEYKSDRISGVYRIKAFCLPENRIAVAFDDITKNHKITKALEESEEKFRLAFTTSPDPIILLNYSSRLIVDVNQGFEKIFGYTKDEVIGKDTVELNIWTYLEDRDEFYNIISEQGSVDVMETSVTSKHGIEKSALISSNIIKINEEKHVLSLVKDISDIKKAQDSLLQKERELRRASKMEAVGTLAGGVAHDFNNIIQIISGNLQLLMTKNNEEIKQQLNAMHTAAMRGSDLATRLLTFSRRVESNLQSVDVNEEIRLAYKLINRATTGPVMVHIDLDLAENLPFGTADPTQLNQVLINLCINAKDAMPSGGRIGISTDLIELDEYYCEKHQDATPGTYIRICIADSGEGMASDIQERIFEPFFTTKELGKGTGLGLSVVYGIMQSHGGYITVYSVVDQGTEFKLYIPVSEEGEIKQESIELDNDIIGGNETILIIDDEADVRDVGSKILKMYGYKILTASDGISGLDLYHSKKGQISLIILDLIMPDMGGTEVLEQLINEDPTTKVIVASGYSANGPIEDSIKSGAKSFINKPYTLRELIREVRKVLDEEN